MWLILQHAKADDYVIATGVQHTVRDFAELVFKHDGIDVEWRGNGLDEVGIDKKTGKIVIRVDEKWFRPTDATNILGNPEKAIKILGWNPQKTSFEQLISKMAEHDLLLAAEEKKHQLFHKEDTGTSILSDSNKSRALSK